MRNKPCAYHHVEDGATWLRIIPPDGVEYDESIAGWAIVHTLMAKDAPLRGTYYRHADGREIDARAWLVGDATGNA